MKLNKVLSSLTLHYRLNSKLIASIRRMLNIYPLSITIKETNILDLILD